MRNERGYVILPLALVIGVVLAILISQSLNFINRTSESRSRYRRQLIVQEIFHSAAQLVYDAYQRAQVNTLCSKNWPTSGPAANVLCLSTDTYNSSCIPNLEFANYPICLRPADMNSTGAPPDHGNWITVTFAPRADWIDRYRSIAYVREAWRRVEWSDFMMDLNKIKIGIPEAHAQTQGNLPPIPAFAPVTTPALSASAGWGGDIPVSCPAVGTPPYRCATIRICLTSATCKDADAYQQRIAFPR